MPTNLKHFSINADEVERAKAFYEKTFGWQRELPEQGLTGRAGRSLSVV
jgi:predicted enzyme related to lactoylglutathione lyase